MNNGHVQTEALGGNTVVDPFGNNAAAALAYKKAEKLITATYLVTNHINKNESLRTRVRDMASELLSDTMELRNNFTMHGDGALGEVTMRVRLILSSLDTLQASGFISMTNLQVLKNAYTDFVQNISAMAQGSVSDSVVLTSDYFSTQSSTSPQQTKQKQTPRFNLNVEKGHRGTVRRVGVVPLRKGVRRGEVVPLRKEVGGSAPANARVPLSSRRNNFQTKPPAKNNDRAQTIIDFIAKRGSASTGDIAQLITDCSSKTLQRDLTKLVAAGTLKKEGEKRWTKYSLV